MGNGQPKTERKLLWLLLEMVSKIENPERFVIL